MKLPSVPETIPIDVKKYHSNFQKLRQLEIDNPHLVIIPSHDPDVYKKYIGRVKKDA